MQRPSAFRNFVAKYRLWIAVVFPIFFLRDKKNSILYVLPRYNSFICSSKNHLSLFFLIPFSLSLSISLFLSRSFSSNIPAFYCVPRERSLTRAFYVRRARFSAVIDATSVGRNPLESIELIQSADFNLMRTRARDLVKFKDTTRNG